jgi:2-aminoadipate transaminase
MTATTSNPHVTFNFDALFSQNTIEPRMMGGSRRGKYDFAIAYPDPRSIPLTGLSTALAKALAEEGEDLALYLSAQGYEPLRAFLAAKLARDRNLHVTANDLLLTAGAGQSIHVILETLVDPGDVVLVDDFTYSGALYQMRRFKADIRGVPTDADGLLPDALETVIQEAQRGGKAPKLLYLIPTFQNPQGWTMPLERRQAVVAVAQKHGIPILEDDCYADLRYDGRDVPSLHELDGSGLVMYVGSFSKTIAPGMRTGFMTAAPQMLARAQAAKSGGPVPLFVALAIHRYATEELSSHIEEINDIQRQRRDAMLAGLAQDFSEGATWSRPQGGLSIWVRFPDDKDVAAIRDKVFDATDVGYVAGPGFAPDRVSGRNYMRLSFGYNTPAEISEGMALLASAFRAEGILG